MNILLPVMTRPRNSYAIAYTTWLCCCYSSHNKYYASGTHATLILRCKF